MGDRTGLIFWGRLLNVFLDIGVRQVNEKATGEGVKVCDMS